MFDFLTTTFPFSWIMSALGMFLTYCIFFMCGWGFLSIVATILGFDEGKLETPRVYWVNGIITFIFYCRWLEWLSKQ